MSPVCVCSKLTPGWLGVASIFWADSLAASCLANGGITPTTMRLIRIGVISGSITRTRRKIDQGRLSTGTSTFSRGENCGRVGCGLPKRLNSPVLRMIQTSKSARVT